MKTKNHKIKNKYVSISIMDREDGTMQASVKPLREYAEKIEKIREEDPQTFDVEMDEKISEEVGYDVETESNYDIEHTGQPEKYANGWLFYFRKNKKMKNQKQLKEIEKNIKKKLKGYNKR